MPRISPISNEAASPQVQELFEAIKTKLGRIPNMMRTMAHSPAALKGYLSLSSALGGTLSPRIREQLGLLAAEVNGCHYCQAAHSALGKMAGLSAAEISAGRMGKATDARESAALRFARGLLEKHGDVGDEGFAAVRSAGFSDGEIAEIIGVVSLNVLTNYFNNALQVEVDFPKVEKVVAA